MVQHFGVMRINMCDKDDIYRLEQRLFSRQVSCIWLTWDRQGVSVVQRVLL